MKKLWLFGAALAMSFSICTSVQAQTPTEQVSPEMKAKIQKMLEVSGAAAVQRLMPGQVTKMMLAQLEKSGKTCLGYAYFVGIGYCVN